MTDAIALSSLRYMSAIVSSISFCGGRDRVMDHMSNCESIVGAVLLVTKEAAKGAGSMFSNFRDLKIYSDHEKTIACSRACNEEITGLV